MNLLALAESRRLATLEMLDEQHRAEMGQYFTPLPVARLMASMPALPESGTFRVLDPGAGSGMLSAAIVDRIQKDAPNLKVSITAIEAEPELLESLGETLTECRRSGVATNLVNQDFVTWALSTNERFDLVIQNPPYRKLRSGSEMDVTLRSFGITVPNVYAAFMGLGSLLLNRGGQQVSITPRSWMNGTYYSAFRRKLFTDVGIDTIHTFESRSRIFGDMGVLQESIIVSGTVGSQPANVRLCWSQGYEGVISERMVPSQQVVTSDFVFVPASERDIEAVKWMSRVSHSLADLKLTVSTGRVVDFRSKDFLFREYAPGRVPMVYPLNIKNSKVVHPLMRPRKPQWFGPNSTKSSRTLVPAGTYVLIKRFSAKEEKRRIVATVWSCESESAIDNKLNFIHEEGRGLDVEVAKGIAVWLNSMQVDDYFRVFSGHTQVNAGDLRQMKFPTYNQLRILGSINKCADDAVKHVMIETAGVAA